jgi:uncharacterized protein involved in exopolysaccharide biosynthesis
MTRDAPYADDAIFLPQLFRMLRRYKWTVALTTFLCVAVAVAAAFLMRPVYRGEVVFAPAGQEAEGGLAGLSGQLGSLASFAGLDAGTGQLKDQALAILQSRAFTQEIIERENLLPLLFEDRWDAANSTWLPDADEPTLGDAFELFEDIRKVSEDRITGIITLAIDWRDRELAARWANLLVSEINNRVRREAISEAEESIGYLQDELGRTSTVELRQALYGMLETQLNRIMVANVKVEYVFDVIDPAVVPDEDKFVAPRRALILILGVSFGVLLGLAIAAIRHAASLASEEDNAPETDAARTRP